MTYPKMIVASRGFALLVCGLILSACQSQAGGPKNKVDTKLSAAGNTFITLGTAAGPSGMATRAQPSNALLVGDKIYLVDAGDGTFGQLVKAGLEVSDVKALFISHNHFDHTGGVLALLGLRMQVQASEILTIYGPPNTKAFIDGLLRGMEPSRVAAYGMPGRSWQANVEVKELVQDSTIELDGVLVSVAENTHFKIPDATNSAEKAKSLSFRFDLEDRSIVYTGDTGPSDAVEALAKDADILISEMMDIPAILERIRNHNPNMPKQQIDGIEWHFRAHHLLPNQVGELAARAKVKQVVVTHMSPNVTDEETAEHYRNEIAKAYSGGITIANDLDRF